MEKIGRHLTFVWRFKHCAKCAHLFVSNRTSLQAIYSSCRLSYVQWAESGGARVVPVIIGRSRQYYEEVGQGSARGAFSWREIISVPLAFVMKSGSEILIEFHFLTPSLQLRNINGSYCGHRHMNYTNVDIKVHKNISDTSSCFTTSTASCCLGVARLWLGPGAMPRSGGYSSTWRWRCWQSYVGLANDKY